MRSSVMLGIMMVAVILLVSGIPVLRHAVRDAQLYEFDNTLIATVGTTLSFLGAALAILARAWLGRNWGMPASRKENPELVTTGPYALVRHPIYAGFILLMLGSTLTISLFWAIPLVLLGAYFVRSARREEKLMMAEFPEQYPAYINRTKILLPFML